MEKKSLKPNLIRRWCNPMYLHWQSCALRIIYCRAPRNSYVRNLRCPDLKSFYDSKVIQVTQRQK